MHLALGSRRYDLTNRALVLGALGPAGTMVGQGADLVETCGAGVPVCVAVTDESALRPVLAAGADLVRLAQPTAGALRLCAEAGVAVVVPAPAADQAVAAGLPPESIVVDTLLLDVTGAPDPTAATSVGVILGARIVRTTDVRGARRICDVLAAVLAAR